MRRDLFIVTLLVLSSPTTVRAHGGRPAGATVHVPSVLGEVATDSFQIIWSDFDMPIPTGTATVELFYLHSRPPTFTAGTIPDGLVETSTRIAAGIPERDLENRLLWPLDDVPRGSYWIWSRVIEPPEKMMSPMIIYFSPAPLSVTDDLGDPPPALRVTRPGSEFDYADAQFTIRLEVFDPTGTASVSIGGILARDPTVRVEIAEGLPATEVVSTIWDTSNVVEGDWIVEATLHAGLDSMTVYPEYFLAISHFVAPDTGVDAGSPQDASPPADAGSDPSLDQGCSCAARQPRGRTAFNGALPLLMLSRRRASRGSEASSRRASKA